MRIFRMVEQPEDSNKQKLNRKVAGLYQQDPNLKECVGKVKTIKPI